MAIQLLPHTAIPTWSGFIYQGRVGLYHILKQLNSKTEDEINELVFQIDSIEDFTILKSNAVGGNTPISMHQVKAVKSNGYTTYRDDFAQLENKWTAIGIQTVDAFFHLATQNEKTKTQIEALHPKIKIYKYENNAESCSLNDIDVKIREQIVLVLQKFNIGGHNNLNTVQLLNEILEKIVSDKVIYIHSLNHGGVAIRNAAFDNPIPLQNFLNALRTDISSLIQDEVYFEGKIRNNLNRYYQEFCLDCEEEDDLSTELKTKMDKYSILFNSYDSIIFKTFLQNIRPHEEVSYENVEQYADSLDKKEMKDSFYQILLAVKESNGNDGIGWICPDNKQYYPTSIDYSNSESSKKKISERIIKTALSKMVDVPFNSDYLITSECNVDNIETYANNISRINSIDTGEAEKETKITQWKKVSLIDLETAKRKLND